MISFIKQQFSGLIGKPTDMSASPEETKGSPGFANYNGFLEEKERNQALTGTTKYITFSNVLANTAVVGAGVRYMLNLIAKAAWTVTPADDSAEAEEHADFVDEVINGMRTPWARVVKRGAKYKFDGFNIQEWTAIRRDDGRLGLLDIESRPAHTVTRWDTDVYGNVRGVIQRSPQTQEEIYLPIEKLLYIVDDSLTDSPEGLGLFRHMVEPINRLKRYEQLEGYGFESDLRGVPVGRAPLTELREMVQNKLITQAESDQIVKPIRDFVSNAIKNPRLGMVIDSTPFRDEGPNASPSSSQKWGVELLRGGNTTQKEVAEAINRLNHEIARLIGVEHILLGADGRGTQALSQDKSHNFFLIIDSALSELSEAFEKNIIDRLWELNGFDKALKPSFTVESIQFRDIEQITGAISDLARSGAMLDPGDPAIAEIYELLGLTKPLGVLRDAVDAALPNAINTEDTLSDDEEADS